MNHTTLAHKPELIDKAQKLIEKSFEYSSDNKFATDFYPLFNKNNFHNCHILEKNEKVLAHIGLKKRKIADFPITMYGGIAVDKDVRGQGLFKNLFNTLITKEDDTLFHILWSNKLDLYKTHNFHPAITLHEYSQKDSQHNFQVQLVSWSEFQNEELYTRNSEIRPHRTSTDWLEIKKITSAQVYLIKDKNEVINYFVLGKGADLKEVIHEYGFMDEKTLNCMRNFGKVWTPYTTNDAVVMYSAVLRIGNHELLSKFLDKFFNIEITHICEKSVSFKFEKNIVTLNHSELLTGILGPTPFEEFNNHKPFFISGLDSI